MDRESVDAVIGFGKNGETHIPVLVLPTKFGDRKQYENINTTSGWSVLTNNNDIESIYLTIEFIGVRTVKARFSRRAFSDVLYEWFRLLKETDGFLVLDDSIELGEKSGFGVIGIPLDVPEMILENVKRTNISVFGFI